MMRGLERKLGRINTKGLATQSRGRIRGSLKWHNLRQGRTCLQLTQDRRRYSGGQLLQALDVARQQCISVSIRLMPFLLEGRGFSVLKGCTCFL